MSKFFLLSGSLLGFLGVAIGAFGAHALKTILEANQRLDTFETAVRYQFYHAFALLIVGLLLRYQSVAYFEYAGYAFLAGVLVFSGSLYVLSLSGIRWLGAITPIGGLGFLVGWVFLMIGIWQLDR